MAETSKIGWTDATQNFWLGCAEVHSGCSGCYAENMMGHRFGKASWGLNNPRVVTSKSNWKQIEKWNAKSDPSNPTVVFTNSLADMFERNLAQCIDHQKRLLFVSSRNEWQTADHPDVDPDQSMPLRLDDVRKKALDLISTLTDLRVVILTKRPVDVPLMLPFRYVLCNRCNGDRRYNAAGPDMPVTMKDCICIHDRPGSMREIVAMPHVWICISISEQSHYDQLMGEFRSSIERIRPFVGGLGLSIEPQLGPITLDVEKHSQGPDGFDESVYPFKWVKVGGESGPYARPFDIAWAESLRLECDKFDSIDYFFKQVGHNGVRTADGTTRSVDLPSDDRKGEKMENVPETIRCRQSPFKEEVRDPQCILDKELADE